MSFQVDRLSSAWAHIARCADPTWTPEPRDAFTVANQRLLAQHCKISQVFRDLSKSPLHSQQEKTAENGLRSVKDVIPESRLAQFYGDFYYDDARDNCYLTVTSNRSNERYNVTRYENSDQTECWMLPEVEYWFRKLTYDTGDRNVSRRRRHCKTLVEEEFERWVSSGERAREETALEARIRGVRVLWQNNPQPTSFTRGNTPGPFARDSSPSASRKMRTRRRQPRRLAISVQQNAALPNQLLCSSPTKFQLDVSRQPPLNFRRALGRLANNHQIAGRGAASRRFIYRSAQAKCTGLATSQKPARATDKKHGTWWPRDSDAADDANTEEVKINQDNTSDLNNNENDAKIENETKEIENTEKDVPENEEGDNQKLSPAASSTENERKKRLYSTVLSMSPPSPVSATPAGSRPQKFTPGLIKLNPKIVFLTRPRPSNSRKFEELEKQALEQYKPSAESIDTKFRELERQAEEQYSPSNSITSCGSHSSNTITPQDNSGNQNKKHPQNGSKAKPLDSVVIYSQNFPDLNSRGRTKSIANLKNFHTPPRGEKKEQIHRTHRTMKIAKLKAHRAASDTEYYEQDITQGVHKNPVKWKIQAKKRHLSFSVSEPSSDEEAANIPIKDARVTKKKNINNKSKVFNQGAGDLQKSKSH